MNKLIFRKLSFDIFWFFLLSSLAITSIVWVIQGVNLLDIISEQGHSIRVYFIYTVLNVPKIFSKLLIFIYFLTLFIVLNRYEESNEILVFWTNGIKKITFINFVAKLSIVFVILQLLLNLFIVPHSQYLQQEYLKNSSIEFFPKLIQEKRFSDITKNLTIFIEENNRDGDLKGIFIKERLSDNESKIIIASKGRLIKENENFNFKLFDGKITNIDGNESINLKFKETLYQLSNLKSKTRQTIKLNEVNSSFLFYCFEKFYKYRKDEIKRCGETTTFLIKDIYEEIFKRSINPIYIIILSLISSLLIIKPKINFFENYSKFLLFILGFGVILFSELSYKFLFISNNLEILFIIFPLILIFCFYIFIFIKSKFNLKYL